VKISSLNPLLFPASIIVSSDITIGPQIAAADWTRGAGAGIDAVTARIRAHCDRFETLYEEVPIEIADAAAPPAESVSGLLDSGNQHADSGTLHSHDDGTEATHSGAWFDVLLRATSFDEPHIAQRIGALSIDVLIDLQGWSDGRRLTALCARAAPIQVFSFYFSVSSACFFFFCLDFFVSFSQSFLVFHFSCPVLACIILCVPDFVAGLCRHRRRTHRLYRH
jgi:hypothetical protein